MKGGIKVEGDATLVARGMRVGVNRGSIAGGSIQIKQGAEAAISCVHGNREDQAGFSRRIQGA